MSLSARIALGPSRRIALVEILFPLVGSVVAMSAALPRWPDRNGTIVAFATILLALFAIATARRARRVRHVSMTVSDRGAFDVALSEEQLSENSWRLGPSTLIWPGFSVVALQDDAGRRLTVPVFGRELPEIERRALSRFLLWNARGGGRGRGPLEDGAGV
jgi:hypothetical protein